MELTNKALYQAMIVVELPELRKENAALKTKLERAINLLRFYNIAICFDCGSEKMTYCHKCFKSVCESCKKYKCIFDSKSNSQMRICNYCQP